ncbi:MAG TPA: hypothetical protein P5169_07625, partial [Kiritimatiellia bacterium]|nr:hypothetical protein [Kiritimatiellia bacterium]
RERERENERRRLEGLPLLNDEIPVFNDEQLARLKLAWVRQANFGDTLNRPSDVRVNRWANRIFTFLGYAFDFLPKMLSIGDAPRGSTRIQHIYTAIPAFLIFALSATIYGLLAVAGSEKFRRMFQGSTVKNLMVFDRDFWADPRNMQDGAIVAMMSSIPLFGDFGLYLKGTVANNRGFSPSARILAFNIMESMWNAARGMYNIANAGDWKNILVPLRDLMINYGPYHRELARILAPDWSAKRSFNGPISVAYQAADSLGYVTKRPEGQRSGGIVYGPTYGIKEDLIAAMYRRDSSAFDSAFKRLLEYYESTGAKNPETAAARDFKTMHPLLKAFGGKKPTDEEVEAVMARMGTKQREEFNRAIQSWDWGATLAGLYGYSPIEGSSGGGGGGKLNLSPLATALANMRVGARRHAGMPTPVVMPKSSHSQGSRLRVVIGRLPRVSRGRSAGRGYSRSTRTPVHRIRIPTGRTAKVTTPSVRRIPILR